MSRTRPASTSHRPKETVPSRATRRFRYRFEVRLEDAPNKWVPGVCGPNNRTGLTDEEASTCITREVAEQLADTPCIINFLNIGGVLEWRVKQVFDGGR